VKAAPRRGVARPAVRKRRRRRIGTVLVFVGLLALLGGIFTAGALAGRLSLRPSSSIGASAVERPERGAKPLPPPQPEQTFYSELTAPLVSPPVPPKGAAKPARREAPPAEPARTEPGPAPEAPVVTAYAPGAPSPPPVPRADGGKYTVQVGSYNARAQADALRARLAAGGHAAYVAEGEAGGVTRYRVRVGTFPSAEEARQAAVRLASDAQVATYVTTK
jgi:DedD protein